MIIYGNQKSKKKRPRLKQTQVQEYEKWLDSVNSMKTSFSSKKRNVTAPKKFEMPKIPEHRSTKHIPSIDSGLGSTSFKPSPVYTGDVVIGIGTMHKSNAVPILRKQDAVDQANMRR